MTDRQFAPAYDFSIHIMNSRFQNISQQCIDGCIQILYAVSGSDKLFAHVFLVDLPSSLQSLFPFFSSLFCLSLLNIGSSPVDP